jgi:organic radical activating enzyme
MLPWVHIAVNPNGDVKPCCISSATVNKQDGTPYNLGTDKLIQIINSDGYKKIRSDMLAGTLVDGCNACYKQEQHGISYRMDYNNHWIKNPSANKKVIAGTHIPETVEYFDLRFGNLCNLKCKSCTTTNSSQFQKEVFEIQETNPTIYNYIRMKRHDDINDWYNTDIFMENIKSQLDNILEIYITGGEPTIIDKNYEMLNYFIEQGKSKNISLKLNTNMTNMQDTFLNMISQFKQVMFFASIDGFGLMQEYIRYPSKWEQIDKNLSKLVEKTKDNIIIKIAPVIQSTNLGLITELFEYLENFNRVHNKTVVAIYPIILYEPPQLNLLYLPINYKKICWDRIEQWLEKSCKFQPSEFYTKMDAIKNKCLIDIDGEEQMNRFMEFNNIFDIHRGVSLRDVNPELYKIVNKFLLRMERIRGLALNRIIVVIKR